MRIGLLGCDDITLAMAEHWVQSRRGTNVSAAVDSPEQFAALKALAANKLDSWERLLEFGDGDVVLVAKSSNEDRLTEQMRQLAQAGLTMAVSHPVCSSMLVYHELDMVRAESQALLIPLLFGRWHPALGQLAQMVRNPAASPIGQIEQVAMERMLGERSRAEVLHSFAQDVDDLRYIAGNLNRLSAMGPGDQERTFGNLVVHLTGDNAPVCHWHVAAASTARGAQMSLSAARGQAILHMPEHEAWRLEIRPLGASPQVASFQFSACEAAWSEIERLQDIDHTAPGTAADHWLDAARAVELAESIERSLRRGRTIEIQNETYSDVATFKGKMASLGCGLIMATVVFLSLTAIINILAVNAGWDRLASFSRFWPYGLLIVLALFLIVQLIVKMAVNDEQGGPKSDATREQSSKSSGDAAPR